MQKTSAFGSRPSRRSVLGRSFVVACAALIPIAGCKSEEPGDLGGIGAVSGNGTGATGGFAGRIGSGGSSGSVVTTGGSAGSGGASGTGATTSSGGSSGSGGSTSSGGFGTGGSLAGGGGSSGIGTGGSGGTGSSSGGTSNGGMGGADKPCMDVEPPPDPNWPDATCAKWANETTECTADWFKTYCDVSCGRCKPANGSGGSSGSGPSSGGSSGSSGSSGMAGSGSMAVDCSTMNLPSVSGGNGYATRYWDCCQTHCGQSDGHRCQQDGTTRTGSTNSACNGGDSFACYDEAPKKVNDCLSYGYIAKANPNCGACYRIQFTGEGQYNANDPGSKAIKGKQMIVKVSNTGGDVSSNQFDMMIPGGGVGQFNACSREWGTSDLGAQYGGFLTNCSGDYNAKKDCVRQNCMKIPSGPARDGCLWFIDWFQIADNPKFTSQQTDCPF